MKSLAELRSKLGEDGLSVVLKVNRIDIGHVRQGETLVVPERVEDLLALSPFPRELNSVDAVPQLMLVSRRVQAYGAYESGKLVRWGPTSTGKKATPTPAGLYHTNWKSKERTSTFNDEWKLRWYFNLDNIEGVSFHEYELPGRPASHSCIRLLEEDAKWIYLWAEQWVLTKDGRSLLAQGTPVVVFGEYDYGRSAAWKSLVDDPASTHIPLEEIKTALQPLWGTILERVRTRSSVLTAPTGPP